MIKSWDDEAGADYLYWDAHDKDTVKRINQILRDIDRNGNMGSIRPEPLKGELSGFFSQRIDEIHRLVYRLRVGRVEIIQCRSHHPAD